MMKWIIILIIVVVIVLIVISAYNKLIRMRNKVDESYATMDVYLKKRFDLIPNLVATVKGYAKHEADTLEKVVAQRGNAHGTGEILDSERAITGAIRNLFAVAESYPDLKANQNFMDLQGQLKKVEEDKSIGTRTNGTVKVAPPKFEAPKDLKVRQADFKD